jgi:UDP-glucose 4-epimerase
MFKEIDNGVGMKDLTILVTGGAGFIGSNLANRLSVQNEVIAIDNEYLGTPDNLDKSVDFRRVDVLDEDLPADVDIIFHLAALSSYQMHKEDPIKGARVNVEGFINTVKQGVESGCERVVYASTSSIYGSRKKPTSESMVVEAHTGYEASKLARERYAEYFHNEYGIHIAGLRFFSVYQGYGGNESHKGKYANIIAQFAEEMANGIEPEVYGDGTQTRDFTHIDDITRATQMVAERKISGAYNVGTGRPVSFNEIVDMINGELGTDIEAKYIKNPIPESIYVHDTCADSTKISEATGWVPEIGLEEGIRKVCSEYK